MTTSETNNADPKPDRPSLIERIRSLFGLSHASIRDDIEDALDDETTESGFTPQERAMLKNVLGLHELRVHDVMVPRADIVSVSMDDTLGAVLSVFRTAGHSRLPVHGESLDDPRGMVHIRDFVDYIANAAEGFLAPPVEERSARRTAVMRLRGIGELDLSMPLSKSGVIRSVLFVPPSMPALDLLVKMQATRTHMALVIDEYGGTDGLASIEDIVEMIVGDIEDEHDEHDAPQIESHQDGGWIIDARIPLDELSQIVGHDLASLLPDDNVDTVGGLVSTLSGRVPLRGETVSSGEVSFQILDADRRRIKRLHLQIAAPETQDASAADESADLRLRN